jgi:hypothetical protein
MADDQGSRKGRPTIAWMKIRTDYLNGETNVTALSKKHGVPRESIQRRMAADKKAGQEWASRKAIRHQIVTDVTSRIAQKIAEVEGVTVAAELLAIAEASKLAAQYTTQHLTDALAGKITPGEKQSKADVYNTTMAGYSRFVVTVREDHGLTAGKPSVPVAPDGARGKVYEIAIRPEDQKTA